MGAGASSWPNRGALGGTRGKRTMATVHKLGQSRRFHVKQWASIASEILLAHRHRRSRSVVSRRPVAASNGRAPNSGHETPPAMLRDPKVFDRRYLEARGEGLNLGTESVLRRPPGCIVTQWEDRPTDRTCQPFGTGRRRAPLGLRRIRQDRGAYWRREPNPRRRG